MLEGKLQYRICTEKKKSRELLWEYCRQLLPCRLFSPSRRFRDCKSDNRHWPHGPTGPRRLRTDTTRTNSKNASNSYTRNKLLQTQRKQVYVGEPEKKKGPWGKPETNYSRQPHRQQTGGQPQGSRHSSNPLCGLVARPLGDSLLPLSPAQDSSTAALGMSRGMSGKPLNGKGGLVAHALGSTGAVGASSDADAGAVDGSVAADGPFESCFFVRS